MPSTYTPNNGIEIIATGEQSGTWGDTTNTNLELIDVALDGQLIKTLAVPGISSSPNALAITDGDQSDGRNRLIVFTDGGDLGSTAYVQLTPNDAEKIIYVRNDLAGGRSIIFFQGTYNASNDFELPAGKDAIVKFNGGGSGAITSAVFEDLYLANATVVTLVNTNLQVSNIAALDGTSAGSIADSTGVVTLASSVLTTADINGGTLDNVTIGGDTPAAATFTTATATNVQVTNIKANDGTSAGSIADSTGVVTLASSVLTTADINGGTLDNVTIGGDTPAAATFTTATATNVQVTNIKANDGTSAMTIADSTGIVTFAAGTTGTTQILTTIEVTNIKANDGTASATIADATGVMTVASSVLTTTDINGGTIDGAVIGGSTPAAISGTTITGTSFVTTGDMTFGDNDKAIFGAGSDLQIYHDGSNSYIADTATGSLHIKGTSLFLEDADGNEFIRMSDQGSGGIVYLKNLGATKLATTATGIDVTGTVTADGLTVDGAATITDTGNVVGSNAPLLIKSNNGVATTSYGWDNLTSNYDYAIKTNGSERLRITSTGSVGIGTSSPSYKLQVAGIAGFANSDNENLFLIDTLNTSRTSLQASGPITYFNGNIDSASHGTFTWRSSNAYTNRMTLDASGNLGLGVTPSAWASSTALQIGATSAFWNISGSGTQVSNNYAFTGGGNLYIANGYATTYVQNSSGQHVWYNAPSGTAGNAITFTQAMTLDASGQLFLPNGNIYGKSDNTGAMSVYGGGAFNSGAGITLTGQSNSIANAIIFTRGNYTESARIDASGRLLIGTTTESGTNRILVDTAATGADALRVQNTGGTGSRIGAWADGSGTIGGGPNYYMQNVTGPNVWAASMQMGPSSEIIFFQYPNDSWNERMRIDASGSVGIGTSSPAEKLQINGGVLLTSANNSADTVDGAILDYFSGNTRLVASRSGATDASIQFFTTSSGTLAERMRIDSSGNVGIGTSSPETTLEVKSTGSSIAGFNTHILVSDETAMAANVGGGILFEGNYTTAGDDAVFAGIKALKENATSGQYGGNLAFYTRANGSLPSEAMRIDASGTLVLKGPDDNSLQFHESGSERARIGPNGGDLRFLVGSTSTPSMTIDASGNLLVGTTFTTNARTTIESAVNQNTIWATSPSFNWYPIVSHNTATSGDNVFAAFGTEASFTQRGSISYNRAGGLTAYNTTSDYRAKDIAGPISDASGAVLNLKPYMGTMKGATVERPMFVAHETQEIAPYAVTGEKDAVDGDGNPKYQQMDHSALVPLLTAALQEALQKIEALEARITALEA
jgi:hypothetical protein